MKTKLFDDGRITIQWDDDFIKILDRFNSFNVRIDKGMAKYFVYLTETLCKISEDMGSELISFHEVVNRNRACEYVMQDVLNQLRLKGDIKGNYMDLCRKDLILSCFKKCFKMKQEKFDLKDINLRLMPIVTLIHIKKGLL